MRKIKFIIATWFYSGMIPPPPFLKGMAGTYGSFVATVMCVPLIILCNGIHLGYLIYWIFFWAVYYSGIWSIPYAEERLSSRTDWRGQPKTRDQNQIVIDEVWGIMTTFAVFLYLKELTFLNYFIAFLLFRFFDIIKPFGIKKIDKIKTPWGVMFDDFFAGALAFIVMGLYLYITK